VGVVLRFRSIRGAPALDLIGRGKVMRGPSAGEQKPGLQFIYRLVCDVVDEVQ